VRGDGRGDAAGGGRGGAGEAVRGAATVLKMPDNKNRKNDWY
jgi:hypothetical protein